MFKLDASLKNIPKITPKYARVLEKIGLETIEDLLFNFPFRYDDFSQIVPISEKYLDQTVTIEGTVVKAKAARIPKRRLSITEVIIQDENNTPLKLVWFNQPFLLNSIQVGMELRVSGKLTLSGKSLSMVSPSWERAMRDSTNTGCLVPIYPETRGLTSKWLRWQIKMALPSARLLPEIVPSEILDKFHLFSIPKAIQEIHFPTSKANLERAQKTFAFQEMFLVQVKALKTKKEWEGNASLKVKFDEKLIKDFVSKLPFQLTDAQRKATYEILKDLEKPQPMNRLLNGDVGAGKTIVAAIAALETMRAGYQVALMAPTEVLARQHFLSISELLKDYAINIALLTNSYKEINNFKFQISNFQSSSNNQNSNFKIDSKFKILNSKFSRNSLLEQINSGQTDLVIGTHAIIQKDVRFKNLALAIIDEQHRFGVMQRAMLVAQTYTDQTQTNTDKKLLYEDLTYKIRGAVFNVKKELGLGHKEVIYQKALQEELTKIGLKWEREKSINVSYRDKKIGTYRPDFVIDDKIILELKALPSTGKFEKQQVWHYLKGSQYKLALLINFGRDDIEIERFIHDQNSPQKSASSPQKSLSVPHLLTMTATPIPRTLAIAFFGSLDLSVLDEMPKNRLPIITKIVTPRNREKTYAFIRQEIKKDRQVFFILPLIEESKAMSEVKAATTEHKRLSEEIFPDLSLGLLHGKLKSQEKETVMEDFKNKRFQILVSTSVIEVGIDIPNASVIVIEDADRFGLTQLHQFRGRVGRGIHQSYCFLFTNSTSEKTLQRLHALEETNDGFKISEKDLELRGPGQFFGTLQSGLPDIAMENLANVKLIKFSRLEAQALLETDPALEKHPEIKKALKKFQDRIHME